MIDHRDQIRIVQETVAGKEITLAHVMGGPAPIIYQKLGLNPSIDYGSSAIGIMNMTPPESAVIASDIAIKSGNVYLGFADRFTGTLIITGDISRAGGGIPSARAVVEAAEELCPVVLAQIGNIDQPQVDAWLDERGINLHRKAREIAPDTAIIGVGGSTFTPFGTPSEFPEARYAEWLKELAARAADHKRLILVSHNPPKDTVCDRTGSGQHVGSRAVREFIEERQPAVCLCGHVHEAAGMQLVGRTQVLNPGSLGSGGYALLRLGEETTLIPRRIGA